jgi:hypothetical protein
MTKFELMWLGFTIVAASTGIVTEAVKKVLTELKIRYYANVLSGIVSVVLSAGLGIAYVAISNLSFDLKTIFYIGGLAIFSWVGAMVGYDKVRQLVAQFKTPGKE